MSLVDFHRTYKYTTFLIVSKFVLFVQASKSDLLYWATSAVFLITNSLYFMKLALGQIQGCLSRVAAVKAYLHMSPISH